MPAVYTVRGIPQPRDQMGFCICSSTPNTMQRKRATYETIVDSGIVAILRGIDADNIVPVAEAMHEGGVRAIEVTADAKQASKLVAAVDNALSDTDTIVGAGTVMDATTARNVVEAGAEFVLSPHFSSEVVEVCNQAGVIAAPGVMTPTEATEALASGADILKLFPASTVGPGHVSALRSPLGDVPVMPTGGVSTANVADYFDAGAVAVGVGSAIVDYEAIADGDMMAVERLAREFVDTIADVR